MSRESENGQEDGKNVESPKWFFLLFAGGFIVVLMGVIFLIFAAVSSGGSASAGIIIFIGPFPIVFGAGPEAWWLILIGVILAAVSVILFLFLRKKL